MKKMVILLMCLFLLGCEREVEINNDYVSYSFATNNVYDQNVYEIISNYDDFLAKTNNVLVEDNVLQHLKKYDENYFEKNNLIMLYIGSGGFIPAKVIDVDIKEDIKIVIEQEKYESIAAVVSGNMFFIEINDKNIINKDIFVYWITGHETGMTTYKNFFRTMQFVRYEQDGEVIYHYFKTMDTGDEVMIYTKDNKTLFDIDYKVGQNYDFELSTYKNESDSTKSMIDNSKIINVSLSQNIKNDIIFNPSKNYNEIIYTSKDYNYEILNIECHKYICKNKCIPYLKINGRNYTIQQAYDEELIDLDDINNYMDYKINKHC